ncbi:oligosaccharide MFS transporter [Liquorilactobacillus uvarum]|uniref:Galactoside permease n=1 Tax=Liquorilactobacillus uvarum DSM 19971 TaxID=1423812 RepID=A0A0R1Q3F7_9LACO|nr:oligosaccharide MFS transporter [Liquorilactobacillus uvarum]KRL36805.1 galactoside permease [Liquorilactobacillus uvarum DSM 19971]
MFERRIYWAISAYFFFFFVSFAACYSLYSIWLSKSIGLNGTDSGIVFGLNAAVTLVAQPLYGYVLDKLGLKKNVLIFLGILLAFSGPFFIYVYGALLTSNLIIGSLIGGAYVGVGFQAGSSALESYAQKISLKYGFEYGRARMWGSLGWAAITFFAGKLFTLNPDYNYWIASGSAVIMLVIILGTKIDVSQEDLKQSQSVSFGDLRALLKLKDFWVLVLFSLGVTCAYNLYDQQYAAYFYTLFASKAQGSQVYGYVNSLQVILEAGMMFAAPKLVNKIGARNSLLLAGLVMSIRIILSGVVSGPLLLAIMKLAEAFEIPVFLVAIFKYLNENFEIRLSSILYLFGFQFSRQLGQIVLSILIGSAYDQFGFRKSYILLGALALLFDIISFFMLKKSDAKNVKSHVF